MKYLTILVLACACTSNKTTDPPETEDTTLPCVVQPDCCSEAACIRDPESYSCDTDCDRSHLSCEQDADGACVLVGDDG